MAERVVINVGGVYYESTLQTLNKSTVIKQILSKCDFETPPFIDRDGGAFHFVLNFLRNGTVQQIDDRSFLEFLIIEAGFYGLHKMESQLSKMLTVPRNEVAAVAELTKEIRAFRSMLSRLDPIGVANS